MPGDVPKSGHQGILAGHVLYETLSDFPRVAPLLKMIDPERGTAVFPDLARTNGFTMYKQPKATPFHLDGIYANKEGKFVSLVTVSCHNGHQYTSTLPLTAQDRYERSKKAIAEGSQAPHDLYGQLRKAGVSSVFTNQSNRRAYFFSDAFSLLVPSAALGALVDEHPVGHRVVLLIIQFAAVATLVWCCILLVETGFATVGDRAVRRYVNPRGGAPRLAGLRSIAVPR